MAESKKHAKEMTADERGAAGLKEGVLRYASDRMVHAQKWRDALVNRRDVLVMG